MDNFDKIQLRKFNIKSILPDATILCLGRRRSGKCLEKGTPVLMYNGSISLIENIGIGDLVMGDDSTPRTVLRTNNGIDTLYTIKDSENNEYTVNGNHILCLYYIKKFGVYDNIKKNCFVINYLNTSNFKIKYKKFSYNDKNKIEIFDNTRLFFKELNINRFVNIQLSTFLKLDKKFQKNFVGYRLPINFNEIPLNNLPYIIGKNFSSGIINEIPMEYKCNSIENRIKLLRGILGCSNITLVKIPKMSDKIFSEFEYIRKSLGLVIKNGLLDFTVNDIIYNKISITEKGRGEYYGFELDSNHKFVLGNFIVTHNSFLVRDIFYNHRTIPAGVVFSGTEEANPFFSDFIPDCFIHSNYDPELVDSILHKQKRSIRENKKNNISIDGKTNSNNKFIVLDDMLHDASTWKKDKTIQNIFFNGRHFNILFILTMQYAQAIPPALRGNVDYVFIFNESCIQTRKKIYEAYGGMIKTFDHFCNILDECTKNYECMVIKTSGQGLKDQVFYYKAEEHTNFKVGNPTFWKYHNNKFNENYAEQADIDAEEFDKIKRKYGKTKKLKVIVSRKDGKILDFEKND